MRREMKSKDNNIKVKKCLKNLRRGLASYLFYDLPIKIVDKADYAFVATSNFSLGYLDGNFIYFDIEDDGGLKLAGKNDILISRRNPFRTCIINRDTKILVDDNVFILEIDEDVINPYYLISYLQSRKGQKALKLSANNSPTLAKKELEDLVIPLKDKKHQEKIGKSYKSLIKNIKKQDRKLKDLYIKLFDSKFYK